MTVNYKKKQWVLTNPTLIEKLIFSFLPMQGIKYNISLSKMLKQVKQKTKCQHLDFWQSKKGNLFLSCRETGKLQGIWKQV